MDGRGEHGDPRRRWSTDNPGNRAIHKDRSARLVAALHRAGAWPTPGAGRVLDLGCGAGDGQRDLVDAGLRAGIRVGLDLGFDRLGAAVARSPGLRPVQGDGAALPLAAATFDAVSAFTVFSSVPVAMRPAVATEVARVLVPGGCVLWYDMRAPSPRNPDTRQVSRQDLARLFPGFSLDLEPTTVLPPVARRLGGTTPAIYPWLRHVPGLSTHLAGVLRKPADGDGPG